ncbi:MAG TPA: hypothetical protein VHW26_06810 [Solirubrobacteraceae bacterium]|jgi:hypothetical protein|nr:hypothetical protein [Solirubrobacteraceae bacterium]
MSQFVDECRREWRRLRVPDAVANEMAADLEADLADAEADGASAEQVLGSGAFDPRAFAASWAAERGVAQPPPVRRGRLPGRSRIVVAVVAAALIATLTVGLAASSRGSAATRVAVPSPGGGLAGPPGPARAFALDVNGPDGVYLPAAGLIVLLVGIAGLILAVLYWSPLADPIRAARRRSSIDENLRGPGYH